MELKKNEYLADVLSKLKDKPVTIVLKNGQSVSCKIKMAGQFCTHIERTDSRSFYDMIIRNEDIIAVESKVRS